jgi:aryl-alcohol dehydrogenase-like predicted oxidoreductase
MKYRELGKTGLKLSAVSYGAASIGNEYGNLDEAQGIRSLHVALDGGVNFIDTSHYSLNNTSLLGLILWLKQRGAGIMNASPFPERLLTRQPLPAWHHAPPILREYSRKAVECCDRKGVDIASLAIRFCVENPDLTTTVAGTANPANMANMANILK